MARQRCVEAASPKLPDAAHGRRRRVLVRAHQLPRREENEWVRIDDFTPGIYANSHISIADPQSSAPPGSAHPDGTWGCAAIAGGGLGPLPGFTAHAFGDSSFPGASTVALVSGFINNPGFGGAGFNELVRIMEADDGTSHYVKAESIIPPTLAFHTILNSTSGTTPGFFGAPYPTWTRMTVSGSGNPPPVLVFPGAVLTDANTTSGHVYIYPELLSPTSYAVQDLNSGPTITTGQVIAYGQRVIILSGLTYSHPGAGITTNENVDYTDPPLSSTLVNAEEVLGAEWPWGYGAWGTVSVGELILIKKQGGALIVNGDIAAPTSVIEVPGVTPTGDLVGQAAATPSGLYYCSEKRGAWVWNGGNVSQKASLKLADDFYDLGVQGALGTNNYGFNCYAWQKYVLFSNNYMLDTETGAWWILSPQLSQSVFGTGIETVGIWWYSAGAFGNQMFASPLEVRKGHNDPYWMLFDNTIPSTAWAWQSVPLHVVPHEDRVLDIREVTVVCSAPDGDTHCSIEVIIGSWSGTNAVTTIGPGPTSLRMEVGSQQGTVAGVGGIDNIQIQVVGKNTNNKSAPILHSIDIGYQVRQKQPSET